MRPAAISCRFGSVSEEDAFLRRDPLGQGLAIQGGQGSFVYLRGKQRVAFHCHIQGAVEHGLESAGGGIHGDDLDILSGHEAGFLERFDGAEGHFVILSEDALDILGFLQPGFGDLLAFRNAPVSGLAVGDLDAAFLSGLTEACATVDSRGGANVADQLPDDSSSRCLRAACTFLCRLCGLLRRSRRQ